ncbi:MAG: hypothetical protein IPJ09_13125 [Saprospiraceae bacterium]|nr:hypothetical protein [Saprospiraceae bacterium]
MDKNKKPVPWWTYPAIDFLNQFNLEDIRVFEWGSGNSTIWLSKRCKEVVSVECLPEWYYFIKPKLGNNVNYSLIEQTITDSIKMFELQNSLFDIIIVDNYGGFRLDCCKAAVNKLSSGGTIILDNSDQCPLSCEYLRSLELVQIDFMGFVPGSGYAQTTSFFFDKFIKFPRHSDSNYLKSIAQPNFAWPQC